MPATEKNKEWREWAALVADSDNYDNVRDLVAAGGVLFSRSKLMDTIAYMAAGRAKFLDEPQA